MGVTELAARPAGGGTRDGEPDASRQGVLERAEDVADRWQTIVSITAEHRAAVDRWLAKGAEAWRQALEPLSPAERRTFIDTFRAYEQGLAEENGG
ncbi:hypothetical protein HUT06_00375 [Actinomadura sp. NAK00032]|uniref:hypothetical protein n=1 Tax=Actinomadura sp. NAK00032 TaxID=2742128 RepID=UPI001590E086|nr:hypothetical protein [Actinomadura sp. NAK00032]QKW32679.1 hypothetical protein HUT06_00375 [Actinomadura sp. NAK00032]